MTPDSVYNYETGGETDLDVIKLDLIVGKIWTGVVYDSVVTVG